MLAKVEFYWRWFGTAFSYVMFGFGGLLIALVVVPLLYCLPGGRRKRIGRVQLSIHCLMWAYVRIIAFLGVVSFEIEGLEKLRDARLILANHPSLLDVVFLISMVPNACCVIKGKLTRNFFTRGAVKSAGYIMNEEAADVIDSATVAMNAGQALIIFPEGTRSEPAAALRFRRGAANIAIRTGSSFSPVLVYCDPPGLTKSQRWYQVPEKRMHLRFLVMDTYMIDSYMEDDRPSRSARKLSDDLVEYFERELETHA